MLMFQIYAIYPMQRDVASISGRQLDIIQAMFTQ